MGTTVEKLNRLAETKTDLKTVINYTGANITTSTPFKEYPKLLNKSYIDILNNGTDTLYNLLPKTVESGTSLDLDTEEGKAKINLKASQIMQAESLLPSAYTQVDYIQSSGTQYIDTGISGSNYLTAILDVQCTSSATGTEIILARSQASGRWFGQSSAGVYTAGTGAVSDISSNLRKTVTVIFASSSISYTIDGTTYSRSASTVDTNRTYTIFAGKSASSGDISYFANARVYNLKFKDGNNNVIYNFIPCYRNSDNVIGLYDIINNNFVYNQGSGSFTYGSVVTVPNTDYPLDIHVITGDNAVKDTRTVTTGITVDSEGWVTVTYNNSAGSSTKYFNYHTNNLNLKTDTNYNIFLEIKNVSGTGRVYFCSTQDVSQMRNSYYKEFNTIESGKVYSQIAKTKASFAGTKTGIRVYVQFAAGQNGSVTFRHSVFEDTSITVNDFVHVPYQEQNYSITLGELEYCILNDYKDQLFKNTIDDINYNDTLVEDDWYIKKNVGKIDSYNGETITTSYKSTTGGLDEGATVYYGLSTPVYTHITSEDYSTLKTELDNIYNNIESYPDKTYMTQTNDDLPFDIELSVLTKIE